LPVILPRGCIEFLQLLLYFTHVIIDVA